MLKIKFEQRDELPLLNIRGKRLLVIAVLIAAQKEIDHCTDQIRHRYRQLQADIDRRFKENLF